MFLVALILALALVTDAYNGPMSKESIFADVLLTELLNRMDKDMDVGQNYFDLETNLNKNNVDLVLRSSKPSALEDYEYRNMFAGAGADDGNDAAIVASHPSLRDQEFLQHSSLWGHQYVSGGMGEVSNRYNTIVKSDASLPAYCNPPNPCPYGYEDNQGCITDFENTAIFSREFQAAQECTCDSEHMFDCAGQDGSPNNNEMNTAMEKFLMHQFQNENVIDNSNAVVKKTYPFNKHYNRINSNNNYNNPFLQGEKLPVAAKKGKRIMN